MTYLHLRRPLSDLNPRRFKAGQAGTFDGIRFRVVAGRKADGDLVLEWETPTGWERITMHTVGLIVDFLYENEHLLYPPEQGHLGGDKLMKHLEKAVQAGWEKAAQVLDDEKDMAETRRRTA